MNLHMTAGRDYRIAGRYEYILIDMDRGDEDGEIVARAGCYQTKAQAARAGLKVAEELYAADPQGELV